MRWLVEVSSLGKTDTQKFCVDAESWQRALQAARSQRGEEGPMSGFSIELLEEGYRAVDPIARVRFVVKRAPDDMALTPMVDRGATAPVKGVAPTQPAGTANLPATPTEPHATTTVAAEGSGPASTEPTVPNLPTAPSSSSPGVGARPAGGPRAPAVDGNGTTAAATAKKAPVAAPRPGVGDAPVAAPRPGVGTPSPPTAATGAAAAALGAPAAPPPSDGRQKVQTMVFGSTKETTTKDKPVERAEPPAIGSAIPGLPTVKLLTSREQNPNDASPLTYREYAFAVAEGTSEDAAADVLRAQLRYVEAHIATSKMGKLVNLACFDVEFTGKPPKPPLATLTWKDWKGDAVVAFPRRSGATSRPPRPPSQPPPGAEPAALVVPPAAAVPKIASSETPAFPAPAFPAPPTAAQAHTSAPLTSTQPIAVDAQAQAQMAHEAHRRAQAQAQRPSQTTAQAAPAGIAPAHPGLAPPVPAVVPQRPPEPTVAQAEPPRRMPSVPPSSAAMVKTPSGRFVRGRVSGDELITSLFESMHDLHFLRDALDGGQFCLALATEVLPARAAIIHFFDIEKREWVVACTRGKETQRLLTSRAPEGDEILRDAARKRRALVVANAETASADRYRHIGGGRSLIVAPIMQAGRALGALEIINPLDGMPFTEDEGNAMTYIAEQFAEYLGSRGIVLDRERIHSAAAR